MITSAKNPTIKALLKLQTRRGRQKANRYLVEGPHLIDDAIRANQEIIKIYGLAERFDSRYEAYGFEEITDELVQLLSETKHPQGLFAEIKKPKERSFSFDQPVLILDGLQDPGNLGTIIRSADAMGYSSILLGEGTVDPYNSKVLRSMQGSQYHVELFNVNLKEFLPKLKEKGYTIAASALDQKAYSTRSYNLTKSKLWGLIVGNEGNGVSPDVQQLADVTLYIPMLGQAESLNAAIAAGILMYQYPPS